MALRHRFVQQTLHNPHNAALLERLPHLGLPDAWLVAGCLFQTVWNLQAGRPPAADIADYDLFYFDAIDLSEQAEQAMQARVNALSADLGVAVEAKNQARVHLWYADWFGFPYAQLHSAREGIARFLVRGTCVGVSVAGPMNACQPEVYAPYGLGDIYQGVLRPNPACPHQPLFDAKARSYQVRWPWLVIATDTAVPAADGDH